MARAAEDRGNDGEAAGVRAGWGVTASGGRWSRRDAVLACLLLAVLAGTAFLFRLGSYRTLGSHEAFAVVPAREMLVSGDWVVPRFGGLPRLKKPPLGYWVVAASAAVCGELNEWSARLPAAVSALSLAALVGWWASRWYGTVAGFAAGLVQLTALYSLTFGRRAEVDMLLWLLMTAALCLVALQPDDETGGRAFCRWVGIYALVSLAWLAKFHYGPALVLAPIVVFYVTSGRYRALKQLLNPVGLLLFAAAAVVWLAIVVRDIPWAWEVWHRETVGRALGEMGRRPVWFFVPHVLALAMPWTPLALAAVPASWRRAWTEADPRERFLWVWFVTQFVIVSLSAEKHKHYIVPALPVLSFLAGRTLAGILDNLRQAGSRLTRWPALAAATGGAVVFFAVVFAWVLPEGDHRRPIVEFSRLAAEMTDDDTPLCVYRMDQDPSVFYLGERAFRVETPRELRDVLSRHGRLHALTFEPHLDELSGLADCEIVEVLPLESAGDYPKDGPRFLVELTERPAGRSATPSWSASREAGTRTASRLPAPAEADDED